MISSDEDESQSEQELPLDPYSAEFSQQMQSKGGKPKQNRAGMPFKTKKKIKKPLTKKERLKKLTEAKKKQKLYQSKPERLAQKAATMRRQRRQRTLRLITGDGTSKDKK